MPSGKRAILKTIQITDLAAVALEAYKNNQRNLNQKKLFKHPTISNFYILLILMVMVMAPYDQTLI